VTTIADAVLTAVTAATSAPTFDVEVPTDPPLRYNVYNPTIPSRESANVGATASDGLFKFQVKSVVYADPAAPGNLRRQAEWMAVRIQTALIGLRIVATGWECGPIEDDLVQPFITDDPSVKGRLAVLAICQYRLMADRI
jgi:hypothetical protein